MRVFGQDHRAAYKHCILIYSIMVIVQSFAAVMGCHLEQNIGPRDTILAGTFLMMVGYIISYWTVSSMFFFTYITRYLGCLILYCAV